MLRDLRLRHRTGQLNADLLDAPNDFRINLESTLAPSALPASLVPPPNAAKFLSEWEWLRSPNLRVSLRGTSREPGHLARRRRARSRPGAVSAECGWTER